VEETSFVIVLPAGAEECLSRSFARVSLFCDYYYYYYYFLLFFIFFFFDLQYSIPEGFIIKKNEIKMGLE